MDLSARVERLDSRDDVHDYKANKVATPVLGGHHLSRQELLVGGFRWTIPSFPLHPFFFFKNLYPGAQLQSSMKYT
jgi:hypothetical protein